MIKIINFNYKSVSLYKSIFNTEKLFSFYEHVIERIGVPPYRHQLRKHSIPQNKSFTCFQSKNVNYLVLEEQIFCIIDEDLVDSYYISKILNVPKAKKHSKYIPLDMKQLQSGETYEISEV